MAAAMVIGGVVVDGSLIQESGRDAGGRFASSAFDLAMARGGGVRLECACGSE
jgi:hypothetical protein